SFEDDVSVLPGMKFAARAATRQLNDQAWRKPVDEFAEPPVRLTDRAASRRLVASVQEVLVHSIYNRNGDVDLTAVRGLLNRHESPHVVLASALAFIGSVDAFRSRVRSVTNAEYRGGRWQSVVDDAFLARLFDRSGPVQTWRGFRIESARLKDLTEFLPDGFTGGAWRAALPQPEADSLGLPEVLLRWRAENDMWPDGRPRETGNLPIGSVEPPSAGGAQQSGAHAQGDTTAVPGHDAESTTPGQADAEPTTPGQDDAEPTTPGQDAAGMTTPEQGDVVADTSARGEVEAGGPVWDDAELTGPAGDDVEGTTLGHDAAGMTTTGQGDVVADTSARGEVEVDGPVWDEAELTVPAADDVEVATSAQGEVEVDGPVWGEAELTVPAADDV